MKANLSRTVRGSWYSDLCKALSFVVMLSIVPGGCKKSTAADGSAQVMGSGGSSAGNAAGPRFPQPVLDLLAGTPEVEQNWFEIRVSPAPDTAVEALQKSSDPTAKQFAELQATLAAEQKDFTEKEAAIEQARRAGPNALFSSHEEDVDTGHHDLYGREIFERKTVDDTTADQHKAEHSLVDLLNAEYPKRFEFVQHIQQLPAVLRQLAAERGARPDGSKTLNIRLNEDDLGTVIVQNTSAQPVHHCLVMVLGEEVPETPLPLGMSSGFKPFASGSFVGHADEVAKLPSVAILYRDQLNPGEGMVAPASKSRNLNQLTASTVTVWSDEVDCPDVVLNDVKAAYRRAQESYQRTQDALAQCAIDQRNSIHVTEENGLLFYRFLVYSQVPSQPIVVPEGNKVFSVAKKDPDAELSSSIDQYHVPIPGERLVLQLTDKTAVRPGPGTVGCAVRALSAAEESAPLVAVWPPPQVTLSAAQQAQHDLLVKWLNRGVSVSGVAIADGQSDKMPFDLQLKWNPKNSTALGSIKWEKDGCGKNVDAHIIDRPDGQSSILIVEYTWTGSTYQPPIWLAYDLHIQTDAKPDDLIVRSAIFGNFKSNRTADVTQQLQNMVKDGFLKADISWHTLPDPARGAAKTLQMEYAINGVVKKLTMNEGHTLVLGSEPIPVGSLTGRFWGVRQNGFQSDTYAGKAYLMTDVNGKQ